MNALTINREAAEASLDFRMDALLKALTEEGRAIERALLKPVGKLKPAALWTLRAKGLSLREVADALSLSIPQAESLMNDLCASGLALRYSVIGEPFYRLTEEGKRLVRTMPKGSIQR